MPTSGTGEPGGIDSQRWAIQNRQSQIGNLLRPIHLGVHCVPLRSALKR